jgi:hypothetical protein
MQRISETARRIEGRPQHSLLRILETIENLNAKLAEEQKAMQSE